VDTFLFLPHMTSYCVSITEQTTGKCNLFVNQRASSGVSIGFTFLPHVIIPDKRHGVHWFMLTDRPMQCLGMHGKTGTGLQV
jgi:hypothetical protein